MSDQRLVIDSSALLAHFNGEPGADVMAEVLTGQPIMSAVNWCEVLHVAACRGADPTHYLALLEVAPLTLAQAGTSLRYRTAGLSLGDRCCLALAAELGLPVLTADRAWAGLGGPAEVRLVR